MLNKGSTITSQGLRADAAAIFQRSGHAVADQAIVSYLFPKSGAVLLAALRRDDLVTRDAGRERNHCWRVS